MDSGIRSHQARSPAAFATDHARFDRPGWRDFSRHLWKTSALSTIAIAGSGAAAAQEGVLWQPQVQTIIGADEQGGYSSLEGFIPLAQTPDSVLFLDLRIKHDFSNGTGGDVGLGFRHVVNPDLILGGYAYLNVERFDGHQYTGATLGVEAIATNFDAHVNVHLPFGDTSETTSSSSSSLSLVGNQLLEQISVLDSRDYASWGIEGEFGVQAPVDLPEDHSLRLHVGGYHFDDVDDIAGSITGGKAGFEYKIGDVFGDSGASVVFGGEVRHDNRDGTHFAGSVRLTVPLGGTERAEGDTGPEPAYAVSQGLRKRANERVRGDIGVRVDTVENDSSTSRRAINARTGLAFGFFFAADGENTLGLGTLGDPTTLDDAVTRAGVSGFVVALGGSGNLLTEGVALQNGQTVIGGGQSVQARLISGATEDFRFGGSDGTIGGANAANPVISLANGNTLNGITVTGGGVGIFGNNINGATLTNVTVNGAGSHGASFTGTSTGVNASNFTSSNNGGSGLSIEGDGTYNFTGTTLLSGNGVDGLSITGDGTYNFQTLNTIDNADDGIDVTSNGGEFTTTGGAVSGNGDVGVIIDPITANVVLTSISHDGGTSGVVLDAVSGSFTVTGETTISNTSGPAIAISNSPASIRFADITITQPGGDGLTFAGTNGPVVVGDLVITGLDAGNTGLDFSGSRTTFTAQSVNIAGTGAAGSTGIDLSATLGGSSIVITAGGVIAGVETGVQLGVNGAGGATANANFVFGGGTIAGSIAALDARGLNPLAGTYAFGSTVFNGAQLFDLANLIFVGSTATGAGDGSSVNDLASIDTADANAGSGIVFALVNDGAVINDADGFTLDDGQTLASFGNGRQFALGGVPLNVTGDNIQHGGTQDDPTGLGAATLTNLGAGSTVILGDGTVIADIGISNGTGESGIFGADVDGGTLTNVSLAGAGAVFTGTSTNVSAENFSATGSAGAGLTILGDGTFVFAGATSLSGNEGDGLTIIGDSDVSFDTLTASGNDGLGIFWTGDGARSVSAATLSGNGAEGAFIDGDGDYSFGALTASGNGGNGLLLQGDGAFSFGGATTVSNNNGAGVFMSGAGDVSFATLDVQNNAGGGIIAFSDPGGTLSVEGGTVSGNDGSGLLLSGTNLDVTLNSVSHTLGSLGSGSIQLSDVGGAFRVTGATTIGNAASGGIEIFGSQADISFGGTVAIDNVGGVGLFINEFAGTIIFEGAVDIGNAADQGVLVNLFDGELTFGGAVDIRDVGSDGIAIAQSSGSIGFGAPVAISGAVGAGILILNNPGDVAFGDVAIADPGGNGVDAVGVNGAIDFGNIDISGLGAAAGLDLSGSTSTFTAQSLDIAGTGATGSTGIDLSGTQGGSVTIVNGGVIQDVDTGVQMGVNGAAGTMANTNFVFGGGSIEGATASLDMRGLISSSGTYAFGSTALIGPQLFDATNVIFVGASATGAGDGSSVNDLIDAAGADAIADANAVFVLVNQGSNIVTDADGFGLSDGQTLASFGNGATFDIGGAPINVTGGNVVSGIVQADPTGNGAARLVNNNAGGGTIVLGSGNLVADLIAGGNATGATISGLNVNDLRFSGVEIDSGFRGLDLDGVTGEVDVDDISIAGTADHGISIVNSAATFDFSGATDVSGTGGDGVSLSGTTGAIVFDSLAVNATGGGGVSLVGTGGAVSFGSVAITGPGGNDALLIDGATGDVSIAAGSISTLGPNAISIDNQGAASSIDISNLDIGAALAISDSLGQISFTGGSITHDGTNSALDIDDTGGDIVIDTAIAHSGNGQGVSIDGASGAVELSGTLTRTGGVGRIMEIGASSAISGDIALNDFAIEASAGGGIVISQIDAGASVQVDQHSTIDLTGADGIAIAGVVGTVGIDAAVNIQNPTATGIFVSGTTGAVDFGGPVTVSSGAINAVTLSGNAGGEITFSGALDIDTSTGVGFNATGGGTISIGGAGSQTIATGGATALQLVGVEIGGIDIDQITVADGLGTGTDAAVFIEGTTGGTLTLGGVSTENAASTGVFIANAAGTYNFNGVTSVDGSQGVGVHIVGSAGAISFAEVEFDDIDVQAAFLIANDSVAIRGGTIGRTGSDAILSSDTSLTVQDLTIGLGAGSVGNGIQIVNENQDRTVTIENLVSASAAGIDGEAVAVDAIGTGTLTLSLQGSTLRSTGTALDVTTSVGLAANAVRLSVDSNSFETVTAAPTVRIDGQNLSATENTVAVQSFAGNTVVGNGVGGGVLFSDATFDADPDAAGIQQPVAGALQIGQGTAAGQRVQGGGLSFTNTSGNIGFTALDIFNSAGAGLSVSTSTTDFTLGSTSGTIDTAGGPAIVLDGPNSAITLTNVTSANSTSDGLAFNDVSGAFGVTGTTTVTNPGATGITINANQAAVTFGAVALNGIGANRTGLAVTGTNGGDIAFEALSISLAGDNAVGVALNDTVVNGDIAATDFDLTSTSNVGTIGVNLVNTTGSGTIRLGDTLVNGGESASITGVDDGVLFSSTTNVNFIFGDGESITDIGSLIDANTPVNTIDTLPLAGNYNFLDAVLVGNTSFLQGASYFVVDNLGTAGLGTFADPGTIAQAEASGVAVIVLVDRTLNSTSDLIDLLLQASGGGANSLDLADGQVLIALTAGEGINVAPLGATATGAPPSFQFAAINSSTITAPTTGIDSVLPVLTTGVGNTVNLAGQAGIQNVLIGNTGIGDGIFGSFGTGENLTIRNSTIGGATALNISATAGATVFTFNDLMLGGTLRLDGTGGDLTVAGTGANTISVAAGPGLDLAAFGVGAGGLNFDLVASGGGASGIFASGLNLNAGNVAIAAVDLDGHSASAISLQNINGAGRSFTIGGGDIDLGAVGTGVLVAGGNLAAINIATAGGLTIDGGALGLDLQHTTGIVNIGTGSGFVAVGGTVRPTAGLVFASSGVVNIGNAANASSIGSVSSAITLASTGTLNVVNLTARSTSASGIAASDFDGSASFDGLTILGISGANDAIDIVQSASSSTFSFTDLTIGGFAALATGNGIDIAASGAGSVEFTLVSGNSVTSTGRGLNAFQSTGAAGTVALALDGTIWETTGAGSLAISVESDTPGGTYVTAFGSNTVTGNGVGGGVLFDGVTFDADANAGNGIQQVVASGANRIGTDGANRVAGDGLSLRDTSGSLDIGALDIFNNSGAGGFSLAVDTTTLGTSFALAANGGTIDNANGGAVFVDTAALSGSFTSTSATFASGSGIDLQRVAGSFDFGSGALTNNGAGAAFSIGETATNLSGGSAAISYGGNILSGAATTGLAVSIAELNGGSVTLSGSLIDSSTAVGGGILVQNLDNASANVTFSGNKTIRTGAANGVTLSNNASGTINFSGGLTIATTTGTGFMASGGGVINVAAAGSQTLNTEAGTALNLNGVTLGSVNIDQIEIVDTNATGTQSAVILNATSGGTLTLGGLSTERAISDAISISNVVSGVYNFNGTTSVLSTGFFADVVSISNSAGTFTFADLDASQLTGMVLNLDASTANITVSGGTIVKGNTGRAISVTGGDASTVNFDANITANSGTGLLFDDADGAYGFGGPISLSGSGIGIDIVNGSAGDFTFDDVTIANTAAATALGTDIALGAAAIAVDIYDSAGATTTFGDLDIVSAADIGVAARDGGIVNIGSAGDPSTINAGFGLIYYDASGTVTNAQVTAGTLVDPGLSIETPAGSSFGLNGQTGVSLITDQVDTSLAIADSTIFGAAGLISANIGAVDQQIALDRNAFSSDGGPGVYVSGLFGLGGVFITSLDSNTMDDGGDVNPDIDEAGFVFENVVFDSNVATVAIETVIGGATRIGSAADRVNNIGLQLLDVTGALSFSDLDIATDGEIAFDVLGAGLTPDSFELEILAGDIDAADGQALWLENATLDVTLSSVTSTNAFGCCFSTGDGILLTGLAGTFEVTGTTAVTGADVNGILIEDNTASIVFGTTNVTVSAGADKSGIDFAGTNASVTFGATTIEGVDAGQVGIDFSDADTTATFGPTSISSTTGSATSTGIDLSGSLGNRTLVFAQGSDIDNLGVGVQLGTAGRGAATANATFTFGDGDAVDGLESFITAAAGGFTVDTIGLDPTSGSYDFDDVFFTGDANLLVAPNSATFVSQTGGQITVGTFGLSQTINTISLAAADALTAAGTIFVFVGPINLAAAGFDLDAGQSITGFGNGNVVSFGNIIPANLFGDFGAGGNVTGNETTISGSDTLFALAGDNEIRHTTFDLTSGVAGSAVFSASGLTAGNDVTVEGVTVTGVGQGRIAFDLTNIASDVFIQNNDISIAGTLLIVSGGSGDITITRGTLPNGGPAGTLSAGGVILGSRVAGSAVTFTDQLTLSSGVDDAVLLTNNTGAAITFGGGLDITTTTGRGFVATGGGNITIDAAGDTEIDTNGGMALFLDTVVADIEFDAVNSTNSATHGVQLSAVSGTLTVNGGLLSGADTAGLSISNSSGTFTFTNVDVVNAAGDGDGVVVANSAAATLNFTDLDITTTATDSDGFMVDAAGSTINVTGSGNTISVGDAEAINFDGGTLNITFDTVNSSAGAARSGIELDGISGTFTVVGGTITKSGTDGAAVDIGGNLDGSGGNAVINIGANLTHTGTVASRSIRIQELIGGSVTLSGNINDSGAGLSISGINNGTAATVTLSGASKIFNTGADRAIDLGTGGGNVNGTINFTNGGLAITTTSGEGFFATAGGTINVSGAANTISTTTGAAIDLNGVAIGGSGFNFATIGVNGAATGINLASVTSAGGGITLGTVNLQNVTSRGVDISTALGAALSITDLDISLNSSVAVAFDLNDAGLSAAVTAQDFDVTNAAAAGTSIGVDLRGTTGGQIVRLGDATVASPAFSSIAGVNTGVFLNATTNAAFTFGDGESLTNQQSTISANVGIDATSAPVAGTYNFQDVVFAASPGNGFGVGDIFFVAATATGDGSGRDASNRATLATAEAASGAEDILVLIDDGGTITAAGTNADNTLLLSNSEQVRGFGSGTINLALTVPSTIQLASTSIAIADPTGGGAATLTTSAGNDAITLAASGNRIDGFILDGDPAGAARGIVDNGGASGTTISNMTIRNFDSFGIEITPSTNTTIDNVTFTGNATDTFVNAAGTTITNVTSTGATGTAFIINNATGTTTLTNVTVTSAGGSAFLFTSSAGTINASNIDIANTGGAALGVVGGTAAFNFDATSSITQGSNAAAVSVSGGHATGTFSFAGTIGATNGTGLQFNNADGTYNFNGTTTLNGGDAGIDIVGGSQGSFTFGTNTTITNPTGVGFNVDGDGALSNGNITFNGTVSKNNAGTLINIQERSTGAIAFNGNLSATAAASGIAVASNTGGTVNFAGATKTLNTGANTAVSLTGNSGATINFTNGGLDIDTTTGTGFSATGGGVVTVQGAGNSIGTTTGTALNLSGVTVGNGGANGFNLASISTNGAANGILLTTVGQGLNSTGIDILGGSIVNASTRGVDIDATSADVSIATTISTTAAGRSVEVTGSGRDVAGGSQIVFSGAIDDNGVGINLDNNDQGGGFATITFSGGLDIDATTNTGFSATAGGTVVVTGATNTIDTTTGTALNVVGTNIGAADMTFRSISSNGAASGIILNGTGAAGGLTVTGDGGGANNGSGGTIQNSTGDGISLTNTAQVRLARMNVTNNLGDGIGGSTINGLLIERLNISGNGNDAASDESGINIAELTGSAFAGTNPTGIINSVISNNHEFEVQITNTAGTLTDFRLTTNTISSNGLSGSHGNLVNFLALGSANMTLNTSGGTFTGAAPNTATGLHIDHSGTSGLMTANVSGGTFTNNNVAVSVSAAIGGNLDFSVNGTTSTGNRAHGLNLFVSANATGTVTGSFTNNTVGTVGVPNSGAELGFGIRVQNEGVDTTNPVTVLIDSNQVRGIGAVGTGFSAININQGIAGQATSKTTNVTITNNSIRDVYNGRAIVVSQNNSTNATSAGTTNVSIHGNILDLASIAGQVGDGTVIRLRRLDANGGVFNVVQAAATAAANANELDDANGFNDPARISISGTPTYNQPAPPLPLMAASNGVEAFGEDLWGDVLTGATLDSLIAAAIDRWAATGLTDEQLAALNAVTFEIADLGGNYLGLADGNHVRLDDDGNGAGWYVDATPLTDEEFANRSSDTQLVADGTQAPAGQYDLLTTIMHEMGHVLGLGDTYAIDQSSTLMYGWLTTGERRLPNVIYGPQDTYYSASLVE